MLDRMARLMGVREVSNAIARPAHADHACPDQAGGRFGACRHGQRTARGDRAGHRRSRRHRRGIPGLAASPVEAGSRRAAFATLDVAPLMGDVAELYGPVADEKCIRLTVAAPPRLPAFGDRDLIQQALANLVDNAVKFSPPGGTVTLSAAAMDAGVAITVADKGPGIPEPDRARAAARFFRGETARNTPGSGLGLALVQAVAQLHGGSLRLADAAPGLVAILSLPTRGACPRWLTPLSWRHHGGERPEPPYGGYGTHRAHSQYRGGGGVARRHAGRKPGAAAGGDRRHAAILPAPARPRERDGAHRPNAATAGGHVPVQRGAPDVRPGTDAAAYCGCAGRWS